MGAACRLSMAKSSSVSKVTIVLQDEGGRKQPSRGGSRIDGSALRRETLFTSSEQHHYAYQGACMHACVHMCAGTGD